MGNQASRQRQSSAQAGTAPAAAAPASPAYAPGSGAPGPHYPPAFRPQVGICTLVDQVETTRSPLDANRQYQCRRGRWEAWRRARPVCACYNDRASTKAQPYDALLACSSTVRSGAGVAITQPLRCAAAHCHRSAALAGGRLQLWQDWETRTRVESCKGWGMPEAGDSQWFPACRHAM